VEAIDVDRTNVDDDNPESVEKAAEEVCDGRILPYATLVDVDPEFEFNVALVFEGWEDVAEV
jgi:hypothetical protein